MKREDRVSNLGRLGYTLLRPETPRVKEHEVLDLLEALADAEDSKQKELVLKKYNRKPLNKTEQEYFSRTVKKKPEAMTNKEVIKVATAVLIRK